MTGILTAIAFLIIFSILILIHEFGHFIAARKAKIKVEEFGLGLPPRAKTLWKDKLGTIFSLNWIPFGGFVKMLGEDATDEKVLNNPDSFASKSLWRRFTVIVAGVTMNFLLAIFLLTIGYTVGMKPFLVTQEDFLKNYEEGNIIGNPLIAIEKVIENSAAAEAGIQTGDIIQEINGAEIEFDSNILEMQTEETTITYEILRDDEVLTFEMIPDTGGKVGVSLSSGFDVEEIKKIRYPFYQAPIEALKVSARLSYLTVDMFGQLLVNLTKFVLPKDVAGPVGIVQMTHKIVEIGEFMELIKFAALLSISLAVINILPFPALDGGRLVFIIYEAITRRKPSVTVEAYIHGIGYLFLMGLIVVITWNDLDRILNFSGLWEKFMAFF